MEKTDPPESNHQEPLAVELPVDERVQEMEVSENRMNP
jgi:hypothetical protein